MLLATALQRALAQETPAGVNPALITTSNEVCGLHGVLRTAVGQPFGVFLVATPGAPTKWASRASEIST